MHKGGLLLLSALVSNCFTSAVSVDSLRKVQWDGWQGGSLIPRISMNRSPSRSPCLCITLWVFSELSVSLVLLDSFGSNMRWTSCIRWRTSQPSAPVNSECLGESGELEEVPARLPLMCPWQKSDTKLFVIRFSSPHFYSFMPRLYLSLLIGHPFCSFSLPCPVLFLIQSAISNQMDEAFKNIFTVLFSRTFKVFPY